MSRFLIDENLPRSLAPRLRGLGFEAHDVRDLGLRGRPDTEVLETAVARKLVLLTGDLGFGSLIRGAPGISGLVLIRLPDEWSTEQVNDTIEKALLSLVERDMIGGLAVVESERIRWRKLHDQ